MAITHTKLEIMNTALRMVGSYHLESTDTTSSTYEISDRAFDDSVLAVFSNNIFAYNTKHTYLTGTDITAYAAADKPNTYWNYEVSMPLDTNLFLGVTDPDGYEITDYYLNYENSLSSSSEQSSLFLKDNQNVYVDYTFIPNLDDAAAGTHGVAISRMPSFLARLVALNMASNMCVELSGDDARAEKLYNQYTLALRRARVMEGRSSPAQQYITDATSSILSAHRNYGKI